MRNAASSALCLISRLTPPFLYPCFYGTDIDSQKNLIACHHTVPEIAEMIGADSLGFLPVQSLDTVRMLLDVLEESTMNISTINS